MFRNICMCRELGGSHVTATAVKICKENVQMYREDTEDDQVPVLYKKFYLCYYIISGN